MAFKHGKNAEIWLDAAEVEAFFNAIDTKIDTDTADSTTFKKDWKTNTVGASQATVELAGYYDPAFTDLEDDLDVEAGSILTVGPAGLEAVGDRARLLSIHKTSYAESSPVGGTVAFKASVMANGNVGFGVVLHPMAAETADANGTTHDGLAATTNGAIAHLHVASVSSGDDITVSLEDSANGTDWTAISGGDFANLDAAGSERIEIAGTIRRYVRAVWDITGDGSESIEFGVALARL